MIVCKFGGKATTSLKGIKNVKKISLNNERRVFVFSAVGKEDELDFKLTDILIKFCKSDDKNKEKYFLSIKNKFKKLLDFTKTKINLNYYLKKIKNSKNYNFIISRGEYITTKIMSKYLNIKFIPSEKLIYFLNNNVDFKTIQKKLNYYLKKYKKICTCGFYGKDEINGDIVLFDRGGGDTTGAIIAKAINSPIYENYTDISGVKMADPKIVDNPKTLAQISYRNMQVLSQFGGSVLHESVCEILDGTNTETRVINIFKLSDKKTKINNKKDFSQFIGYKKNNKKIEIIIKSKIDLNEKIKNIKKIKNYFYMICEKNDYKQKIYEIYNLLNWGISEN